LDEQVEIRLDVMTAMGKTAFLCVSIRRQGAIVPRRK
jgi:hypothetical protein